jgi:hypothetical protein
MRDLVVGRTERGFVRYDFTDRYGERCSLQMSSLASEPAIWLGQNAPTIHHVTGDALCRMHLTQDDARWLSVMLRHFADTGELLPITETQ